MADTLFNIGMLGAAAFLLLALAAYPFRDRPSDGVRSFIDSKGETVFTTSIVPVSPDDPGPPGGWPKSQIIRRH